MDFCTTSGSGTFTASDAQSPLLTIRPTLLRLSEPISSYYRTYLVQLAFLTLEPVVTTTCSQTGTSSAPFGAVITGGLRGTPFGDFEISNDGASIQKQWTLEDGQTQLELDLSAVRE